MSINAKKAVFLFSLYAFLSGCSPVITKNILEESTLPKREFRAVWVATIDNIDWPSKKGLPSEMQQQDFRNILQQQQSYGMNAVLVQVRAAADAFYTRSREPWSEWLSGEQGKAPSPFYDPLTFMIQETHQRGMEFHAWLNMNRGTYRNSKSISSDHITFIKPEWFLTYGGNKFFNLGIPEVRDYIASIVVDIVKNYDVDGIHFDDYFYPYVLPNETLRDYDTFLKYNKNFKSIEDWRRNNVDLVIKNISELIKKENPRIKFGISPSAVWRNKSKDPEGSATNAGQPSYDNLFADTRKWIREGWIDYIMPQIYFSFESDKVPYQTLTDWWATNVLTRHLYIGHAAYRLKAESSEPGWNKPSQISNQIRYNRSRKNVYGSAFFSAKSLSKNDLSLSDSLKKLFSRPALMPKMPWKDNISPLPPKLLQANKKSDKSIEILWQDSPQKPRDKEETYAFVIYRFNADEIINIENPSKIVAIVRNEGVLIYQDKSISLQKKYKYVVTALDRLHNESAASNVVHPK